MRAFASLALLVGAACGAPAPEPEWLRVTKLSVPASPREAGCSTVGSNAGGGLSDLVLFTGGLQQYVEPRDGFVRVALLAEVTRERGGLKGLDFQGGRQAASPQQFRVSGDDEGDGVFGALAGERDGWFVSEAAAFRLPVPVLDELMLRSRMEAAKLEGKLADGSIAGVPLLLTGYYSEAELRGLVEQVLAQCAAGKARNICGIIERETGGMPEKALDAVVTLMGGADTAMVEGRPAVCGSDTGVACDAVSVCLQLELGPAEVVP